MKGIGKLAGKLIYSGRWLLFPLGVGMLLILFAYVLAFFWTDVNYIYHHFNMDMSSWALFGLSFVDAYMIANLMLMVSQGSFQIFIQRFDTTPDDRPQYLDHLDSGLLKVKISQSIGGIMFVELLQDFIHVHDVPWNDILHRLAIFGFLIAGALVFAGIWRVTHPSWQNSKHDSP
jgi:uncharacterized protein (TIGR00645 family)